MLETLFSSVTEETLTIGAMLTSFGTALVLGLLVSLLYLKTHKNETYSSGFTITLIMLPAIIAVIIMLIGNNVARAFSLAGAFSLIRFRSAPGDSKDISYVFFTLAVGLACGMGYIAYAVVFAFLMCLVMLVLHNLKYAKPQNSSMQLKILVPETLNFEHTFDDILEKFTDSWNLKHIKTSDFGTLFEVAYSIKLKQNADRKKFLDEIRCRNGNLNITLTMKEFEEHFTM